MCLPAILHAVMDRQLAYLMARIDELEKDKAKLASDLEASHRREEANLNVIDRFRLLNQQTASRRVDAEAQQREAELRSTAAEHLSQALLRENEELRQRLAHAMDAMKLANITTAIGRAAVALGVTADRDGGAVYENAMHQHSLLDRETALQYDVARLQEALRVRTVALNEAMAVIAHIRN